MDIKRYIPRDILRQRTAVIVGATVLTVFIAFMGWLLVALRPADAQSDRVVTYTLAPGTGIEELSQQLRNQRLIRSPQAFTVYATLTGARRNLQAGSYDISPSDSSREILEAITGGNVAANTFVVTEGLTMAQIKDLAKAQGINAKEFDAALAQEYEYPFLAQRPAGASLEGYLFPDSYQLIKPVRPVAVVRLLLENFQKQLAATDFEQKYAAKGLSLHQAVTLASIVEREVRSDEDRALVAQLYMNRLAANMPLQADPTALYGAEIAGRQLSPAEAVRFNSPYNTYLQRGLPPGPISNPGLSALRAVANPRQNDYLYFLSGNDGKTHFARTYEEHQRNIERYLN